MKRILYILSLLLLVTACDDENILYNELTPEQKDLIGSAVNFNITKADEYQTRVTYNETGVFNEGDMMIIYRQYEKKDGTFDWQNEVFRTYELKYVKAPGTDVMLEKDWIVYEGRKKGDYVASGSSGRTLTDYRSQNKADSITWENGETVRFRSWARSNLSNALNQDKAKAGYYPDFMVSDWVTVSGPTMSIPLTLRHPGARLFFSVKNNGNSIQKVEICTEASDYEREDNADTTENDQNDKKILDENGIELSATQAAANVLAAFNRMTLPAGIDIETGLLTAMTKTAYTEASDEDIRHIEEWTLTNDNRIVRFGDKESKDVATDVQRPSFVNNNSNFALITIPYDISSDHGGEPIVLPPYTRFRVTLLDVSQETTHSKLESTYHIFSLNDVRDSSGEKAYPKGLEFIAGASYQFHIGYRYNKLTIDPGDSFSWDQQTAETGSATDETNTVESPKTYSWWKSAIHDAIQETMSNKNYAPEFHISTVEQFLELIQLVNGDAGNAEDLNGGQKIYRLVQEYEEVNNDDGTISKNPLVYGWSLVNDQKNPQFVEKSVLEALGYVFYEHYYPSDANREAYFVEDYLRGPYAFYDEKLNRHFKVVLDADLDFADQKIVAIGKESITFNGKSMAAPFKGIFNGYNETQGKVHTLKNLNVNGYYLFNYVVDGAISNLKIETSHTIGLVKKAEPTMNGSAIAGWGCYISGISVKANNQVAGINAIAATLTGPSSVVGCIHEGDASAALVGVASDLRMYGCMRTAANISGSALLGAYADNNNKFFDPQIPFSDQKRDKNYSKKASWGNFMCNYYNKDEHDLCKDAVAVANISDNYSMLEYIRGRQSRILRALNDNMLSRETPYDKLTDRQLDEFYGLAPWKAMNYAIYKYNLEDKGTEYPCMVHYKVRAMGNGYDHTYPQLLDGKPDTTNADTADILSWNVLTQSN